MRVVSANGSRRFFGRGTVTSRILLFTLSQMGIHDASFRERLSRAVRSSPFDPYDPALAAEEAVKKSAPRVFRTHEAEWLRQWDSLHKVGLGSEDTAGPDFWLKRVCDPSLTATLQAMRPYRQRCCRRYLVSPAPGPYNWRVVDLGTPVFTQRVADARARVRRFSAPPRNIVDDSEVLQLLAMACEFVSRAPTINSRSFQLTMHLMLTHAGVGGGKPAPEGMHQDGANYIVSAIVLERRNVVGGASVISVAHEKGPPAIDSIELAEGQGIFQADMDGGLWHGVTPVKQHDPTKPAYRSILGFDISFAGGAE